MTSKEFVPVPENCIAEMNLFMSRCLSWIVSEKGWSYQSIPYGKWAKV